MNTKICTSIEQSKRLIELGLDINTADMCYLVTKNQEPLLVAFTAKDKNDISAWSLAALLNVLPRVDVEKEICYDDTYNYRVKAYIGDGYIGDWFDNLVDACYEMILKLHELKML